MTKLLIAAAVTATAVLIGIGGPVARADTGDNTAVVINTHDGSSKFKIAFAIRRVHSDVVDAANSAVAVGSCTSCETVAIAVEALLITDNATVIDPTNFAFAYNVNCNDCETLATAYQYVFTTGGQLHFTPDGNRRLAQIHADLEQLRNADLDIFEVQMRVNDLAAQVYDVIKDDLVSVGKSP